MEKFNVEVYDFPRQEIEAENAEKAARKYFSEHQMAEQMIKNVFETNMFRSLTEKVTKRNS